MSPSAPTPTPIASPEQQAAAAEAEARLQQLLAMGDVYQSNAATGIWGDSGAGKSIQCATAVEYNYRRYGRISRYYSADPGGFGNKLLRLIRLGICQVWNPTNHIEPFETMEDASLGYWPEKIDDPNTGYAQPDVRLIAPQTTTFAVLCTQGHIVRAVPSKALLHNFSQQCPTCKGGVITPQNWGGVEEVTKRAPGVANVGLYVYDSGTSLQDWAMQDMASRAARGEVGGEGSALGREGKIVSGRYVFGANNRAHYGFAQNRMHSWIKNSRTVPGQVLPPIWTFLALRSTDDGKGVPIFGPKIAGNAKTGDVPSWLGNCLEATKEENDKGKLKYRLWLTTHTDKGSIVSHLAKTRAEPGTMPDFLEDTDAQGQDLPEFTICSMGYFFSQLEHALDAATRQDAIDFPDAPAFKPLPQNDDDVVSKKSLSGSDLTGRPGGPPRPSAARPSVAGQPKPAAPPVAGPASSPATQAVPTSAAQQASQPSTAPAPVAKPRPVAGTPVAQPPKPAAPVAQVAAQPPQTAAPKPSIPSQAKPAVPGVQTTPVTAPAPPTTGSTGTTAAPAAVTAQPTAAPVRPQAVAAVRSPAPPAGRPPVPPPGAKK